MDIRAFWKKFVDSLEDKTLFYVTLDPMHASGLHDVIPNYHIICPWESALVAQMEQSGARFFVLEREIGAEKTEKAVAKGTYGILQHHAVRNYIHSHSALSPQYREAESPLEVQPSNINTVPCVLVLKNTEGIERVVKENGWKLLGPNAKTASIFEEKISQYRLLSEHVPFPETCVKPLAEIREQDIGTYPVLMQFNRGHTGTGTITIPDFATLEKFKKLFPKREVKISEYIKGETYTLNGLVTRSGTVYSDSISLQITGFSEAASGQNTTVGNDFGFARRNVSPENAEKIKKILENTGRALYGKGYKGLFGIDIIISPCGGHNLRSCDGDKFYFIEVNTHQPASIPFENVLQRKIDKIPLFALYLLDQFNLLTNEVDRLTPPLLYPEDAKQVIYRNKSDGVIERDAVRTPNASDFPNAVIVSARLKYIKPNEELYRLQYVGI